MFTIQSHIEKHYTINQITVNAHLSDKSALLKSLV